MAKKASTRANKTVESLKHDADKRKNIPTAEFQSVLKADEQKPVEMRYPRNTDLDPQLVWRGKDEQDWSDLVSNFPPSQNKLRRTCPIPAKSSGDEAMKVFRV